MCVVLVAPQTLARLRLFRVAGTHHSGLKITRHVCETGRACAAARNKSAARRLTFSRRNFAAGQYASLLTSEMLFLFSSASL